MPLPLLSVCFPHWQFLPAHSVPWLKTPVELQEFTQIVEEGLLERWAGAVETGGTANPLRRAWDPLRSLRGLWSPYVCFFPRFSYDLLNVFLRVSLVPLTSSHMRPWPASLHIHTADRSQPSDLVLVPQVQVSRISSQMVFVWVRWPHLLQSPKAGERGEMIGCVSI